MKRLLLFLLTLTAVRAAPSLPLQAGEQLVYRVSWAVLPGAGEIKITAQPDQTDPARRLRVTTQTATRRFARMLLTFDATSEALFDLGTGRMTSLREKSEQGEKKAEHAVSFDYGARRADYTSPNEKKTRALAMPEGDPTDLIMALMQTRSWDLKPGEKRDALVLFDDDFYELTIHFARYEEVRTPLGKFQTMVLEPRMDKTAPKGMFKRGSKVRVWITREAPHLPVKFDVEFKIGTGTAVLESYTPAAKPAASPAPATPPGDATNPRP